MLWKLMTRMIAEEIYRHLEEQNLLQWEKKDVENKTEGKKTS